MTDKVKTTYNDVFQCLEAFSSIEQMSGEDGFIVRIGRNDGESLKAWQARTKDIAKTFEQYTDLSWPEGQDITRGSFKNGKIYFKPAVRSVASNLLNGAIDYGLPQKTEAATIIITFENATSQDYALQEQVQKASRFVSGIETRLMGYNHEHKQISFNGDAESLRSFLQEQSSDAFTWEDKGGHKGDPVHPGNYRIFKISPRGFMI